MSDSIESLIARGALAAAHAVAERALAAAAGSGAPAVAQATHRLGAVLARIGDLAAARETLERARALLAAIPGPAAAAERATVLADLAALCDGPDAAATTCALLAEALALRRSARPDTDDAETARLLARLGLAEAAAGAPAEGVARCEAALALLRRIGAADAEIARRLIELGSLRLTLGEVAPARAAAAEALCRLAGRDLPAVEARARLLLAAILAEAGAAEAAILCEKDVVDLFQGMRGGGPALDRAFLAAREDAYRRLADDLMAAGRLAEAQQVLAMLREAELGDDTEGVLPGPTRCSRSAAEQAASAAQTAARAAGPAALAGWLDGLQPALARPARAAEPPAPRAVAGDERQLQFLLADGAVRIILGAPDGQRLVEAPLPAGEVHRRVLALRAAIAERSPAWRPHAEALHALLLGPVWPALAAPGVRRLTLSLDGVLRHLPFALLHDGERHLVERFALTVAAGPAAPPRAAREPPRIAAFGLTRRIGRHPALPGVAEEIAALVRDAARPHGLLPGEARLDEAFTADALGRVLAAPPPVLHLASHFVLRTARHEDSYLLLGDGARLSLAALARLDFSGVELLFLSACDTATAGGTLDGLGALARRRGAGAVVATLWPVRDHGSAALALDFYRHRFVAGHDAATALALAQRAALDGGGPPPGAGRGLRDHDDEPAQGAAGRSHPYHWAAHMLLA